MANNEPTLLERIEEVVSKEAGDSLLWDKAAELTDGTAAELSNTAQTLLAAGDRGGFEEYQAWAELARSLVTLHAIRSTTVESREHAIRILESNRDRFDDAFIGLLSDIGLNAINAIQRTLVRTKEGTPLAPDDARAATEASAFEAQFLSLVANISAKPAHRQQALFVSGTHLLVHAQLEEAMGKQVADLRNRAKTALTACAEDQSAPAVLRARAEGNLAAAAGQEHPDQVAAHQGAAQALFEQARDLAGLRTVRRDRAFWADKRGDWHAAYGFFRQNIEDAERALIKEIGAGAQDIVAAGRIDCEGAVEACLKLTEQDPSYCERALEAVEQGKARTFLRHLARLGSRYKTVPQRLKKRRERILARLQELGDLQKYFSSNVAEHHLPEMNMLLHALGRTEARIESYASATALDMRCVPLDFEHMRFLVPKGGAILSYFSLSDRLLIFVLTEQGLTAPPVEVPLSRKDLARVMANVTAALRFGRSRSLIQKMEGEPELLSFFMPTHNLTFLYYKLIEPVKEQCEGLSPLYIIPDGPLLDLPFHALQKEDGRGLIDDAAIACVPGVSVLRHCRDLSHPALNTCYAAGVSEAKGGPKAAMEEARVVAGIFGTTPEPATCNAVVQKAGAYDIIHLSCHSDVGGAVTAFQGLRLEDGTLSQREIAGMECRASLVVLSACATASGDLVPGQEMAGLAGAFIRAGAASVMASLWPVPVRVACPMMEAFYTALKKPNMNKAEALRQAQIELKSREPFSHPYYWAPFALWGTAI